MNNSAEFQNNLSQFSSQKLCEVIITYQYLGLMKDEAILAMQELAKRRASGDLFQFETVIEEELKKLPDFKKQSELQGLDLIKGFNPLEYIKDYVKTYIRD